MCSNLLCESVLGWCGMVLEQFLPKRGVSPLDLCQDPTPCCSPFRFSNQARSLLLLLPQRAAYSSVVYDDYSRRCLSWRQAKLYSVSYLFFLF